VGILSGVFAGLMGLGWALAKVSGDYGIGASCAEKGGVGLRRLGRGVFRVKPGALLAGRQVYVSLVS